MNKVQTSRFATPLLLGVLAILSGFAFVINFSKNVEANGIQQVMLVGVESTEANPTLFVASPQHDSTLGTNVVQYNARFSWISCGNEPAVGSIKVYERVAGGKVSSKGNGEGSAEWKLLGQNSMNDPLRCSNGGCERRLTGLNLTGTFTLNSLNVCKATTLWTIASAMGTTRGAIIYDFTWLTRVGCATPTPTPTPRPTPTPTPTPTLTPTPTPTPTTVTVKCADGSLHVVANNANVNCNINNNNVAVNVNNSSNNSSSNSSSSSTGNVNVTQNNTQTVAVAKAVVKPKVASAVLVASAPAPVVVIQSAPRAVPVTAKTGAEGMATLIFSTLFGGSGLTYMVRKTLIG